MFWRWPYCEWKDIYEVIMQLKFNKSDGDDMGLMSNHIIHSSEMFKKSLAKMFTEVLTYGYQPKTVVLATIASIPKDSRGNIWSGSNHRGVTISSSIPKLVDIIMIIRYKDKLQTSDMQFAFKEKHSTAMCSLVVKEVIHYYIDNKSDVYSCCVDTIKAFDSFNFWFICKVPAKALRTLLDMYEKQCMRTMWKEEFSELFTTTNGIRQGGLISPVLFCI